MEVIGLAGGWKLPLGHHGSKGDERESSERYDHRHLYALYLSNVNTNNLRKFPGASPCRHIWRDQPSAALFRKQDRRVRVAFQCDVRLLEPPARPRVDPEPESRIRCPASLLTRSLVCKHSSLMRRHPCRQVITKSIDPHRTHRRRVTCSDGLPAQQLACAPSTSVSI